MIFFITNKDSSIIETINEITREWTAQAARGECGWICSDCSVSFHDGMPDECMHGYDRCTKIIQRDKQLAMGANERKNDQSNC